MSGIEFIVGSVLASIPLALEAYDRSGRAFEIFSVFKQYPREVSALDAKLSTQRTIFRNNAINLLVAITKDRIKVDEVLNQPSSSAAREGLAVASAYHRRPDDLEGSSYRRQEEALNNSIEACRLTAMQILGVLDLLYSQSEAFQAQVGERRERMSASNWLKHVRTRFKLGLNKPRIIKAIEELRALNSDFGLITEQIIKALRDILNDYKEEGAISRKSMWSLNVLQKYHRARSASKALYTTLQVRWRCSSHRCHSFDMRILDCDPRNVKGKASMARYVTCELAITNDGSSYAYKEKDAPKEPLRLEIEQACEWDNENSGQQQEATDKSQMLQLATVLETLNVDGFKPASSVTSTLPISCLFKDTEMKKQERTGTRPGSSAHRLPNPMRSLSGLPMQNPTSLAVTTTSTSASDLSLIDDFCTTYQEATTDCTGRSLLGFWRAENGPDAKWFCIPPTTPAPPSESQSLSDIIRWIAEEPILRSLPRPLLVELAGDVAEGIMQLYSTPWLATTNLGQNVRYFSRAGETPVARIQLRGPYFMTRLERNLKAPEGNILHSSRSAGLPAVNEAANFAEARNKLLFSFGILLLEIGYVRPWHELRQTVAKRSAAAGAEGGPSDYLVAEKLAQLMVNQMGLTYSKIIRKCLGCDFGLGETDLDNEDLQRRFLEDVVSRLQQLRQHMREVNFAPLG